MTLRASSILAAGLLMGAVCLTGCQDRRALRDEEPSHAADVLIEKAQTPEERRALERARDEIDLEMRARARALDSEIEALRRENEELARKLREP